MLEVKQMQIKTLPFEEKGKHLEYETQTDIHYRFAKATIRIGNNGNSRNIETIVAIEIAIPENGSYPTQEEIEKEGFRKATKGQLIYRGGILTTTNVTLVDHVRKYI